MKRLSDLTVFLAVARQRSFRRAAADLGVTPSALSHALRTLEERLDVRLVNRTTRSVALTEAGQRLFDRVQPAFRDIERALDDLAVFRSAPATSSGAGRRRRRSKHAPTSPVNARSQLNT